MPLKGLPTKDILPSKAASEKVLLTINGSVGKGHLIAEKGQSFWWQIFVAFILVIIGHWVDEGWNAYCSNYNRRKKDFQIFSRQLLIVAPRLILMTTKQFEGIQIFFM